jgi:predicted nucleotidyltransferase component of viral defense system
MQSTAKALEAILREHLSPLQSLDETTLAYKSSPEKWSKKEIIGHLIDSAQCNIRRFVVAQYEENPRIVYDQEKWVTIAAYQHWNARDLIDLWHLLNKQIVEILKRISPVRAKRQCQTEELHAIEWLAQDYLKHLTHHLHQVLELKPIAYP